jgi:hypothetical protein
VHDHWFAPLAELRASSRPDRQERIRELDDRFRALLGISLLELETETTTAANEDFQRWTQRQLEFLEHGCQSA